MRRSEGRRPSTAQLADVEDIRGVGRAGPRELGSANPVRHDASQRRRAAHLACEKPRDKGAFEQEQVGARLQQLFQRPVEGRRSACRAGRAGCRHVAYRPVAARVAGSRSRAIGRALGAWPCTTSGARTPIRRATCRVAEHVATGRAGAASRALVSPSSRCGASSSGFARRSPPPVARRRQSTRWPRCDLSAHHVQHMAETARRPASEVTCKPAILWLAGPILFAAPVRPTLTRRRPVRQESMAEPSLHRKIAHAS